jgi:hypothetical protein
MQSKTRKETLCFYPKTLLASTDSRIGSRNFLPLNCTRPHQRELRMRQVLRFPRLLFWESKRASSPISNGASFLISLRWAKLSLAKI